MHFFLLIIIFTSPAQAQDLATLFKSSCQHAQKHEYHQAIDSLKVVVGARPDFIPAVYNLAYCLKQLGRMHEAIFFYEKVLRAEPHNAQAHYGYAQALLAIGNFETGWEEFQWRVVDYKRWKREPQDLNTFKDKVILLRAEFGLGDTIQFVRYAKLLKEHSAIVYVQTFDALVPLFSHCKYIDKVIPLNGLLPPVDYEIPLLSMPRICNSTNSSIPVYDHYLKADKQLVEIWRQFFQHKKRFNIGICWQAKPTIFLEDNPYTKRSVLLELFQPIAEIPGVQLFSLQKKFNEEDTKRVNFNVETFSSDFDESNGRFMDTAAIMMHLDLITSIDTSIVHLAGALGRPVWVLLPSVPEWRWTCKTQWYSKMKFFKQEKIHNWKAVFEQVQHELIKVLPCSNADCTIQ